MNTIDSYALIVSMGVLVGILSNKLIRGSALKSYYTIIVGSLNIIIAILILESVIYIYLSFYDILIHIILFSIPMFISFYVLNYLQLLRDINISAFILTLIIIVSLTTSSFYVYKDAPDAPTGIINPAPSTSPLLQDYTQILVNPKEYHQLQPHVILPQNLENYTYQTYKLLGTFINQLREIKNLSDYIYLSLHNGDVNESKEYYSKLMLQFNNFTNIYNNITYYARLLSSYSEEIYLQKFLHILKENYTNAENIVQKNYILISLIDKLPRSSHIPVEIKITTPTVLFNTTTIINGTLLSPYNITVNGTIFISYLNFSEVVNVTNGTFSFPLNLQTYLQFFNLTILYEGNSVFLPNITKLSMHSNVVFTKIYANIFPSSPLVGTNLTIIGNVTGYNRTLIISLLNYTKTYIVSENFSIQFPLPYNISNNTYVLTLKVLPKGYLSPVTKNITFVPKLYHENLTVNINNKWIIPLPLKISGKLYYNNTPLNGTEVFIFIGNSRYEAITHNGYFSIEVKPKLSILYGKQVIYIESDPQYTFYREVIEANITVYNALVPILLIALGLILLRILKRHKKNTRKREFKLKELAIKG
ncbi:hypothetical protein V6M85_02275 [Sulfolobus tengchongensis]|uniref:Uncharacterized protein n=1 Tax=Sulfolobus tengchongensis TaxID=207809 RepID=A0AAX4L1A3_9CREN